MNTWNWEAIGSDCSITCLSVVKEDHAVFWLVDTYQVSSCFPGYLAFLFITVSLIWALDNPDKLPGHQSAVLLRLDGSTCVEFCIPIVDSNLLEVQLDSHSPGHCRPSHHHCHRRGVWCCQACSEVSGNVVGLLGSGCYWSLAGV